MSTTATHRPVDVPTVWIAVIALARTALVIALASIDTQGATLDPTGVTAVSPAFGAASVPLPESLAVRRAVSEGMTGVDEPAVTFIYPRNHMEGTTVDAAASG